MATEAGKVARAAQSSLERIMKASKPNLYETNAFAVLGLPSTATLPKAEKKAEDRKTLLELGISPSSDEQPMPYPRPSGVGKQEVDKAIQRLRDPHDRILEELFHYHLDNAQTPQESS